MKIRFKLHIISLSALIAVIMMAVTLLVSFYITEDEKTNREHIDNATKIILEIQQHIGSLDDKLDDKQIEIISGKFDDYILQIKKYSQVQSGDKRLKEIELLMSEINLVVNQIRQLDILQRPFDNNKINERILKLFEHTEKFYLISRDKTSHLNNITIYAVISIGFASILMMTIHSTVISRDIVNPLLRLQTAANIISDGNLNFRIDSKEKDEIGQLSRTFDEMAGHLASALDSLKKAEAKYKTLVETINDWVYETDFNGNYLYVSPKVKDILGYEPEEVIGKTIFDFMQDDDATFQMKGFKSFCIKGTSFNNWVLPLITKQGNVVYIESNGNPKFDEKGQFKGFIGANRNISKRIALEKQKDKLIDDLSKALDKVKTLSGFLPICASCKKVRDDKGYWQQIEAYISEHSEAEFSHSICPNCAEKLYPEYYKKA